MATWVPASPRCESPNANCRIADYARFAHIRFSDRCEIRVAIAPITTDISARSIWFRRLSLDVRVPLFLRALTSAILLKGAGRTGACFASGEPQRASTQ